MKNKDLPAMPISGRNEFSGLTKREYFAAHAPDMPEWFESANRIPNPSVEDVFAQSEVDDYKQYISENFGHPGYKNGEQIAEEYAAICWKNKTIEDMRLFVDWRWHYADMMMEGE